MTPPAALVGRFRADLVAVAGEPVQLAVAVSGGPDSLALLLLAAAAMPGRVAAATVDHGLRPESGDEARFVASVCQARGIPHATLAVDVPGGGEGLQGEARRVRYEALVDWCAAEGIGILATAHHADDQAETLLMRLRRGAGVSGLAGVRPRRAEGAITIVRPLLGWSKDELAGIVAAAGLTALDDPSNRDPRFDRAEMRAFLAERSDFSPHRLAASAAALADAEAALGWMADWLWHERVATEGAVRILDPAALPAEMLRRLVTRLLAAGGTRTQPRSDEIARLIATLGAGGKATLGGLVCIGGAVWTFAVAPPRRTFARNPAGKSRSRESGRAHPERS